MSLSRQGHKDRTPGDRIQVTEERGQNPGFQGPDSLSPCVPPVTQHTGSQAKGLHPPSAPLPVPMGGLSIPHWGALNIYLSLPVPRLDLNPLLGRHSPGLVFMHLFLLSGCRVWHSSLLGYAVGRRQVSCLSLHCFFLKI